MSCRLSVALLMLMVMAVPVRGEQPVPISPHTWELPQVSVDLTQPPFNPPDCPPWAKEQRPEWLMRFTGMNAAPAEFARRGYFGGSVQGVDLYHANWFIWYHPETAAYLYSEYTPLEVGYVPGTLPAYEKLSAKYTKGLESDTEKAIALLMALAEILPHPGTPPFVDKRVRADRNLDDEDLLASGGAWCNEQARVFIRLCQVNNIPARMVHLFGQGHTTAEFHADGRWAFADVSFYFVAKDENGLLLSTAQCHDGGEGQRQYAYAKKAAKQRLADISDEQLNISDVQRAQRFRDRARSFDAEELAGRPIYFGVINYPLPPAHER